MKQKKLSFTLIEMLIVVVVLGVLAIAMIPRLQTTLARTRNSKRLTDARTIYQGLKVYNSDYGSFPPAATLLEGSYITSLPADPSGLRACIKRRGAIEYSYTLPDGFDGSNYYPIEKGYYYNKQTDTYRLWGVASVSESFGVIGTYMEKVGVALVSNVPLSSQKFIASHNRGGSGCPEYAWWTAILGIGRGSSSYTIPDPEAMNTPEVMDLVAEVYSGIAIGGMGSALYDMTEGDYVMLVTK